jgi:hypothetical protein
MHARRGVILIILEGQRQEDVLREHRRVHVLERTQPVLRRRDGVDGRAAAGRGGLDGGVEGIHLERERLVDLYRPRAQRLEQVLRVNLAVAQRGVADGEHGVDILAAVVAALVERDVGAGEERELEKHHRLLRDVGVDDAAARGEALDVQVGGGHVRRDVEQLEVAQVERLVEVDGVVLELVALEGEGENRHLYILCTEISFVAVADDDHRHQLGRCGGATAVDVVGERAVFHGHEHRVRHGGERGDPHLLGEAGHLYTICLEN